MILDAASRYDGMDEAAQRSLVEGARHDDSPVPEHPPLNRVRDGRPRTVMAALADRPVEGRPVSKPVPASGRRPPGCSPTVPTGSTR